ncbi:hypothetical protein [Magnetovibrio sp.]|uniref:hypothetical protein n=1 Tax=Magnetovibrio sp. TaxID=2024836 RepID=UPI002F959AE3
MSNKSNASHKTLNRILIGAALVAMTTVGTQAIAADTYAEYETQASLGNITQMPGKYKRETGPRKINHAQYEVMAEKGIFIQPKRHIKTPAELAKRRNHAEYDATYDEYDG